MKKINAEIIADSRDERGNRITSFILTYPRFIHAELMTHRMFSRNSASSRAIPFEKMLKMVKEDPFIPIAWQKDHKGMQGTQYIDINAHDAEGYPPGEWLIARDHAMDMAEELSYLGVTKQICNRLLEPFMWHTVLVTATEYDNFFELRCPKYQTPVSGEGFTFKSKKDCIANHSNEINLKKLDEFSFYGWQSINQSQAEIHIQALAEYMWNIYNESTPRLLQPGDWHLPFGDQISTDDLHDYGIVELDNCYDIDELKLAISSVRCARLSYMTFENEIDYYKDMELYFRLIKSKHMSPFEHVAKCMSDDEYVTFVKGKLKDIEIDEPNEGEIVADLRIWNDSPEAGWCNNFKGFIPYRYIIENNGKI